MCNVRPCDGSLNVDSVNQRQAGRGHTSIYNAAPAPCAPLCGVLRPVAVSVAPVGAPLPVGVLWAAVAAVQRMGGGLRQGSPWQDGRHDLTTGQRPPMPPGSTTPGGNGGGRGVAYLPPFSDSKEKRHRKAE